jgi:S-adenosylmethionine/arginine decarboxylase-like enzyme
VTKPMHLIADLTCSKGLADAQVVEAFMREAITVTALTICHFYIQEFANGGTFGPGVTGMALLSESSMVVHTAPERKALNLDLFSCRPFSQVAVRRLLRKHFGFSYASRWDTLQR